MITFTDPQFARFDRLRRVQHHLALETRPGFSIILHWKRLFLAQRAAA
jgi:hypothetical protein